MFMRCFVVSVFLGLGVLASSLGSFLHCFLGFVFRFLGVFDFRIVWYDFRIPWHGVIRCSLELAKVHSYTEAFLLLFGSQLFGS